MYKDYLRVHKDCLPNKTHLSPAYPETETVGLPKKRISFNFPVIQI